MLSNQNQQFSFKLPQANLSLHCVLTFVTYGYTVYGFRSFVLIFLRKTIDICFNSLVFNKTVVVILV